MLLLLPLTVWCQKVCLSQLQGVVYAYNINSIYRYLLEASRTYACIERGVEVHSFVIPVLGGFFYGNIDFFRSEPPPSRSPRFPCVRSSTAVLGTAAYQLGNISSRMITEVKQR